MDKERFQAIYERVRQRQEAERKVREYARLKRAHKLVTYTQVEAKSDAQVLYAIKLGVRTVPELLETTKYSIPTIRGALIRLRLRGLVMQDGETKPADRVERRGRRRAVYVAVDNEDVPLPEMPPIEELPPLPDKYK